jgi:hypothetical protein
MLKMSKDGRIPEAWILLDNQSTIDVLHNEDLLNNIRPGNGFMDIHCNAGVMSTSLVGIAHPDGIANILSLSRIVKDRVTLDSVSGNVFNVHKPNGTQCMFQQSNRGLYYTYTETTGITLVNTVEGNKSKFTNRDLLCGLFLVSDMWFSD